MIYNTFKVKKTKGLEKKMLFLMGYKTRELRLKAKKTRKEVSQFLDIPVKKLGGFEKGELDLKLSMKQMLVLFKFLKGKMKDIYLFQILSSLNVDEVYGFYKKKTRKHVDYIDHLIETLKPKFKKEEIKEVKKILRRKI